jgi:hypothetical protein
VASNEVMRARNVFQFTGLTVCQSIHRVHDYGLDAFTAATPQDVVHDRYDIGKALARASAGTKDIVLSGTREIDGLLLVQV